MADLDHFYLVARQIRTRVPVILLQWGLPTKFNRWRLTRDSNTGMVVLFAVINTRYTTPHTPTPYNSYFDSQLLRDLTNDFHMQVVPCSSDGLSYAFILDRGQVDMLPAPIDFPFLDGDRLFLRLVNSEKSVPEGMDPQFTLSPLMTEDVVGDQPLATGRGRAFLQVSDDVKLKDAAVTIMLAHGLPDVVGMEKEDFIK